MKKLFSMSLLFVAVLVGCDKDDDVKLSVEQQLTASTNGWVLEHLTYPVPGFGDLDVVAFFEDCDKDDAFMFASDGKYTVAENTKCDESDPTVADSGTWTLNSDKTILTITSTIDGTLELYKIEKLAVSDTSLTGEVNVDDGDGNTVTAHITLKKK